MAKKITERQTKYLQSLRKKHGLSVWNSVKDSLGITKPGVFNLTLSEASKLISSLVRIGGHNANH